MISAALSRRCQRDREAGCCGLTVWLLQFGKPLGNCGYRLDGPAAVRFGIGAAQPGQSCWVVASWAGLEPSRVGLALVSSASAVTNAAWLSCTAGREFQHGATASEADGKEQIQPVHCEFFAVLFALPWTGNQCHTVDLECVSPLTAAVGRVWP
jgi:hypothetical protein